MALTTSDVWAASGVPGSGRVWVQLALEHAVDLDPVERDFLRWSDATLAGISDDWASAWATTQAVLEDGVPEAKVVLRANLAFMKWGVNDVAGAKADLALAQADDQVQGAFKPYLQWVVGSLALAENDFAGARDAFALGMVGGFTTFAAFNIVAVAALEAALGHPDEALRIIDDFEWELLPVISAEIVRSFALAGLGRDAEARAEVFAFARRASLGRLRRQANDALLGLALVALADGDRDAARVMVMDAAIPRSPHTLALSLHLAEQVGARDEVSAMMDNLRATSSRPDARPQLLSWMEKLSHA